MISKQQSDKNKQGGIALLVLVIVIALTVSAYYFSSISAIDIKVDNLEKTRVALKQAKQALINYAVTHADGNGGGIAGEYGYLPCPDSTNFSTEGNQDPGGNCRAKNINILGYLPWKSLDLPALKDGSGNCLWYAVSGSYKGDPSSGLVNEDTNGLFQVVGGSNGIVAVVFAPGAPLAGQARTIDVNTLCGKDFGNEAAYLEGDGIIDNSSVPNIIDFPDWFIHASLTSETENSPYNDYFLTITREEIWHAIMQRSDLNDRLRDITEALTMCLANYANNNTNRRLPWPALMNIGGGDYRVMSDYEDRRGIPQNYAGRFPFYLNDSNGEIGKPAGYMIDMGFCSSLQVTSGATVDLQTIDSEYRIILNNWKDHFFYAVSKHYALPDNVWQGCGECVSFGGADYSAIVFFSGSPYSGFPQLRNAANKAVINNYLENGNAVIFPDTSGEGSYTQTSLDPDVSNDIVFCTSKTTGPLELVTRVNC